MSDEGIVLDKKRRDESSYTFMYFKQVPKSTVGQFKELAEKEFAGHFGFCLKAILDGTVAIQNDLDIERIERLEQEVAALKSMLSQPIEEKKKRVGKRL